MYALRNCTHSNFSSEWKRKLSFLALHVAFEVDFPYLLSIRNIPVHLHCHCQDTFRFPEPLRSILQYTPVKTDRASCLKPPLCPHTNLHTKPHKTTFAAQGRPKSAQSIDRSGHFERQREERQAPSRRRHAEAFLASAPGASMSVRQVLRAVWCLCVSPSLTVAFSLFASQRQTARLLALQRSLPRAAGRSPLALLLSH